MPSLIEHSGAPAQLPGTADAGQPEPGHRHPGGAGPEPDSSSFSALLGAPRATVLGLLAEPLPTVGVARRLGVTPSAVFRHLKVLHVTGLVTRAGTDAGPRDGRRVLYRRGALGDGAARDGPRHAARDGRRVLYRRGALGDRLTAGA